MKVLIVDDDALIRDSLKILIGMEADMEVVGTATNAQEALVLCKDLQPDIVLMDIRMPVMDGVLGTKLMKSQFSNIKVIILTTFKDDEYIKEAIKNGASGYMLKNQSSDSIIECLRAVHMGSIVLEKEVAQSLTSMLKEDKKKQKIKLDITEREWDVLKLVGEGLTNREIADKLYLSEGTVRNYVTMLLEKLSLRDRTQLAIYYVKNLE
ncbi:MAG: two component transcriptional regulator, LuxR family [Clostridia bacterium]|jgi:DNA-binding NarL/FixJ family response regulator|nr:two component transcriptional regulator, LuxR family [Clostridia bacterium]